MARTELPNGIILPAEYSDDWYDDMTSNLSKLDDVIGSDADKLSAENVGAAALSNDYADLDNKPTIPTKTSDLTNDSNFVDTSNPAVASGITSAKVTDYDTHIADTDIHVTTTDKATWNTVTSKANDSDVVHKSGDETVDGLKTFLKYVTSDGSSTGDEYSSNTRTNLWLMSNRDTEEVSGVLFDAYRQNTAQGTGIHILGIGIKENSVRYEGCRFGWYWYNDLNGYSFDFKPTTQGANQALKHNLGTSVDKWDTINGINPGALSMPDLNSGIDISSYITLNSDSSYTPLSDGYIYICCYSSAACCLWVRDSNNRGVSTRSIGSVPLYNNLVSVCIPVVKNVSLSIFTPGCENILTAKFYPCQGNV